MTLVVLVGDSEIVTDCVPFPRLEGLTHVIKGRFLLRAVWCLSVGWIVVLG